MSCHEVGIVIRQQQHQQQQHIPAYPVPRTSTFPDAVDSPLRLSPWYWSLCCSQSFALLDPGKGWGLHQIFLLPMARVIETGTGIYTMCYIYIYIVYTYLYLNKYIRTVYIYIYAKTWIPGTMKPQSMRLGVPKPHHAIVARSANASVAPGECIGHTLRGGNGREKGNN